MKKTIIIPLISLFIALFLMPTNALAKIETCPNNINKLEVGDECKIEIINLHPTQREIGLYQVKYNEILLDLIIEGKSKKYDSIKDYLIKQIVPVVIGPNQILYMVDRHHTLRGIWEYFNHDPEQKVYIKIIHYWSKEKNFWQKMKASNYVYLGSNNQQITPEQLPSQIGDLINNNYRSAVGLAVTWTYFHEPKGEAKYFYQFKWGDCLQKLGFSLPTELQRDEIYATAAFLHSEENQAKFPSVCNLNTPEEISIKDFISELESK